MVPTVDPLREIGDVLHDICAGLLEPDEADARPRRRAPTKGHAFTIPIRRVEHSLIQQAGSNGPHWASDGQNPNA